MYVFWWEADVLYGINRIRYKYFDGNVWNIDPGLMNFTENRHVNYWIDLNVFNNELYGFYGMLNSNWNVYTPYVKKFSDDNPGFLIRSLSGGIAFADDSGACSYIDRGKGAWPTDNEHDEYLVKSSLNGKKIDNYDLWNMAEMYEWCKETPSGIRTIRDFKQNAMNPDYSYRSSRGNTLATSWRDLYPLPYTAAPANIGLRPVLEYVETSDGTLTTNLYY
jgi:hypothetical protein